MSYENLSTAGPRLQPQNHHGSWWVHDFEHDCDTGPYSTREQAQEWIDSIVSVKSDV